MNQELLHKAAVYCSRSEHCIAEVTEKLTAWGAEQQEIQPIIDYLIKEQYINQQRYCQAFVNDKLRFAKWGKQKIAYMLAMKHIDRSVINDALDNIDYEEYISILTDLLRTKQRSIRSIEPQQQKLRLYRYAASRGFTTTEISNALKQL